MFGHFVFFHYFCNHITLFAGFIDTFLIFCVGVSLLAKSPNATSPMSIAHIPTIQNVGLFCASSNTLPAHFYAEAGRLGNWIGATGRTLVYGGANCGLMEATARGVREAVEQGGTGRVVGVTPQILIDRQRVSQCIDEQIVTADLNMRKHELLERSDIIVVMPGSLGTLDEAFTVMASNTIGLHAKRVVFWNIDGFWDSLFDMLDVLLSRGVVNRPYEESMLRAKSFEELTRLLDEEINYRQL